LHQNLLQVVGRKPRRVGHHLRIEITGIKCLSILAIDVSNLSGAIAKIGIEINNYLASAEPNEEFLAMAAEAMAA
jgi:hypothetical protein